MLREVFPFCLALVMLLHLSGWVFSTRWSRNREIQVSQFFCLSQKSLAVGLPIASVIFSESQQNCFRLLCLFFAFIFYNCLSGPFFEAMQEPGRGKGESELKDLRLIPAQFSMKNRG